FGLGIFIKRLRIRMGRGGIEVKIAFFHVLAVIALAVGKAEKALLQDRILAVPQRQRETEPALAVGEAEQPVLAPAISAAAGVVVWKILPASAVRRIILAHGGPLALGQVRTPPFPVLYPRGVLLQTDGLGGSCLERVHRAVSGIDGFYLSISTPDRSKLSGGVFIIAEETSHRI